MSKRPASAMAGSSSPPKKKSPFSLSALTRTQASTQARKAAAPKQGAGTRAPTRAMVEERYRASVALDHAVASFMGEMYAKAAEHGAKGEIEVEVRLGELIAKEGKRRFGVPSGKAAIVFDDALMRDKAEFRAGVRDKDKYNAFKKQCTEKWPKDWRKIASQQTVRTFDVGRKRIVRTEPTAVPDTAAAEAAASSSTAEHAAPTCALEQKVPLGQLNLLLPQCPFDLRVTVSCEISEPCEWQQQPPPDVVGTRHKRRVSLEADSHAWRVDLTEVRVEDRLGGEASDMYEIELELRQPRALEWLKAAEPEGRRALQRQLVAGPGGLIEMLRYFDMNRMHDEVEIGPVPAQDQAKRFLHQSIGVQHYSAFPGTMPVAFTRRNIEIVQAPQNDYYASEKTDGVRYILVVHNGSATLMDRKEKGFTTLGLPWWGQLKSMPEGTVIDGEYVWHIGEKRYIFLAFDLICIGGTSCANEKLVRRLQLLQGLVNNANKEMQSLFRSKAAQSSCLNIHMKHWHQVKRMENIFGNVGTAAVPGEARIYMDREPRGAPKRWHRTDGVVLAPNDKYICGAHQGYLKWKWADLVTIDFRVRTKNTGTIALDGVFASGEGMSEHDLSKMVRIDNMDTLLQAAQSTGQSECVAEFGFIPDSGRWHYKCLRPDKVDGNYIDVVMDSLMQLAEGISEQELRYRLTKSKEEDDWERRFEEAKNSILARGKRPPHSSPR